MTWVRLSEYVLTSFLVVVACVDGEWWEGVAWACLLICERLYHIEQDKSRRTFQALETCLQGNLEKVDRLQDELLAAKVEVKQLKHSRRLDADVMKAIKAQCGLWETGVLELEK